MRWSSKSALFLSAWALATSAALAQETSLRIDLVTDPAAAKVGEKVDDLQNWEVVLDDPAVEPLRVDVEVTLISAVEPCATDPAPCDGSENFIGTGDFGEPIYACADEMDNNMNGLIDAEDPDCVGVQGWSFSINTGDCFNIQNATTRDTVGGLNTTPPGMRDVDGGNFEKTEIVNPDKPGNNGRQGAVSAVVLSFANPVFLPQVSESLVFRAIGLVDPTALGEGEALPACPIEIISPTETGLAGSGEPVQTAVTVGGVTDQPNLCNASFVVRRSGGPAVETVCDDEIDNDEDGLTDCDDDDCDGDPACPVVTGEICDDEIDNDDDGLIDGDDPDCQAQTTYILELLEPAGVAGDKVDGVVPYEIALQTPADSVAITIDVHLETMVEPCASQPELCDDTEDFVTVDDFGEPVYGCADEVDNNMNGLTDIEDPDCIGPQGWSISVATDDCFGIQRATTRGTVGDLNSNPPGMRDLDGGNFEKTEVVNPANNNGQQGAVSAVVLSFGNPVFLDQTGNFVVLKLNGLIDTSALGAGETLGPCAVTVIPSTETGLQGAGEPVQTAVTIGGATDNPNLCDLALTVRGEGGPPQREANFQRGDANDDGKVNIADPVWIISALFREGPPSPCDDMADANDDGVVDQSDALFVIMYQFDGGPEPSAPFPDCGKDPTADTLPCEIDAITSCAQDPE